MVFSRTEAPQSFSEYRIVRYGGKGSPGVTEKNAPTKVVAVARAWCAGGNAAGICAPPLTLKQTAA